MRIFNVHWIIWTFGIVTSGLKNTMVFNTSEHLYSAESTSTHGYHFTNEKKAQKRRCFMQTRKRMQDWGELLLLSVLENSQNHNAMTHFHTENDRAFPAWFTFSLCRSQVSADLPKQGHVSVHIARITYISCSLSPFLAFSCFFHLISN